jgi:hypothetical protein
MLTGVYLELSSRISYLSYKHYRKGLDPVQTAFAVKQFKSHRKVGTPAEIKQLLAEREFLLAQKASIW